MTDFRKLLVWEKAHAVAVNVHHLAAGMRKTQFASIRNQMIRASESVPTNIVEGCRQSSRRDFARFLRYALNSASELEYHFILAGDIGALTRAESASLIDAITEIRKMLHGLLRRMTSANPIKGNGTQRLRQNDN
jgi:four helix bundle protein